MKWLKPIKCARKAEKDLKTQYKVSSLKYKKTFKPNSELGHQIEASKKLKHSLRINQNDNVKSLYKKEVKKIRQIQRKQSYNTQIEVALNLERVYL